MSDRHAMVGLISEFGRSIGMGDLELDEEGYCALLIDEALVINMEFDEARRQLLLYSLLGEVSGNPRGVYSELLEANHRLQGTGGATLGLMPEGSGVVLSLRVPAEGLTLAALTASLEGFLDQVDAWTKRLPQLGGRSADSAPLFVDDASAIRI